jgi:hypothetical protein
MPALPGAETVPALGAEHQTSFRHLGRHYRGRTARPTVRAGATSRGTVGERFQIPSWPARVACRHHPAQDCWVSHSGLPRHGDCVRSSPRISQPDRKAADGLVRQGWEWPAHLPGPPDLGRPGYPSRSPDLGRLAHLPGPADLGRPACRSRPADLGRPVRPPALRIWAAQRIPAFLGSLQATYVTCHPDLPKQSAPRGVPLVLICLYPPEGFRTCGPRSSALAPVCSPG